jgi:glycosyltransferase involved in cell wall biosynthesis
MSDSLSGRACLGIYCTGAGTGGPWRYVHSLLAGIDSDEFEVRLFCDLPGAYEPRPEVNVISLRGDCTRSDGSTQGEPPSARSAGRSLKSLVPGSVRLWSGFSREVRRLAGIFSRHPVDLLHTQNTGCEESPVAARVAGIQGVLGTFHVDSTYDLRRERGGFRHRLLEVVSNRCLDAAIAVSRATKYDWVRRTHLPARRVVTIHNGIDPDKFTRRAGRAAARRQLGLPDDGSLIIGGVGRLDEAKGFSYLIDAVAQLAPRYPRLLLVLAGTGPLHTDLVEQASRLGITDRVRFMGFVNDVQPVFDALDVFALSSLCEALPYALLEAMATELPVIGTSVGGVPEVISVGETGFIVPPRNADALARALTPLLDSPELRERMGKAGRQRVLRHFQECDMVRRTLELYRDLLGSSGMRRIVELNARSNSVPKHGQSVARHKIDA